MNKDYEDSHRLGRQPLPGFDHGPGTSGGRREPRFDVGGADDDYEEPDRDTNYASGFREEELEEDSLESLLPDELEDSDADLFDRQAAFLRAEASALGGRHGQRDPRLEAGEPDAAGYASGWRAADRQWQDDAEGHAWEPEEEDYAEDDEGSRWPLGLIAVAVLAVLLVIGGGYGIVQQRAAAEAELLELQAALATAASPEEVAATRQALQETRERNAELTDQVNTLERENLRLRDTVAGLEAQLAGPASAAAGQAAEQPGAAGAEPARPQPVAPKPAAPKPAAPKPATTQPAAEPTPAPRPAAATGGDWFVNFGSYGQPDMAREWAARLKPTAGEVVVAESARDGDTFYRVRVIGLADQAAAEQVARQLERTWGLSKLWVGRD